MIEVAVKVAFALALIAPNGTHTQHHHPGHKMPVRHGMFAPSPSVPPITHPSIGGGVGALTSAQVASYARGAGFPESVIPTMVSIAYRESNWIPTAVNLSSGACGLWQLYPCPGIAYLEPARNAAGAYAKYQASGLSPWGM